MGADFSLLLQERIAAVFLAVFLDHLLGEVPNRFHPVAWMGSMIALLKARRPKSKANWQLFLYGAWILVLGFIIMIAFGALIGSALALSNPWLRVLLTGFLLQFLISLRKLTEVAEKIRGVLASGDLAEGRRLLSWHLVSRDTEGLSESEIAGATIESVAENTSDSVIAPLFFFLLGGLPGALVYRFANTADAMIGYRDELHEWLGKVAAKTDDLFNLIPARLTGAFFWLATPLVGGDWAQSGKVLWMGRTLTDSPNAGYPMSAAAGALGVKLSKRGQYLLGADGRQAQAYDLKRMVRLARSGLAFALAALLLLLWIGR